MGKYHFWPFTQVDFEATSIVWPLFDREMTVQWSKLDFFDIFLIQKWRLSMNVSISESIFGSFPTSGSIFRNKNLERRWCMFSQVPKTSLSITHNQKKILDFDRIFPLHKIFDFDWIHVYIQEYKSIKYIEHAFPFCFSVNSRKF